MEYISIHKLSMILPNGGQDYYEIAACRDVESIKSTQRSQANQFLTVMLRLVRSVSG